MPFVISFGENGDDVDGLFSPQIWQRLGILSSHLATSAGTSFICHGTVRVVVQVVVIIIVVTVVIVIIAATVIVVNLDTAVRSDCRRKVVVFFSDLQL